MRSPKWTYEEIAIVAAYGHRNGWKDLRSGDLEVGVISELLRNATIYPDELKSPEFRNRNGVELKYYNLSTRRPGANRKPTRGSKADLEVLDDLTRNPEEFLARADDIRASMEKSVSIPDVDLMYSDVSVVEGGLEKVLEHLRRERNRGIRKKKISEVLSSGRPLDCEVCGFNFEVYYGGRGVGYIEIHHRVPLSESGATTTSLDDLALVCANCHRMIHVDPWATIDELREQLGKSAPEKIGVIESKP